VRNWSFLTNHGLALICIAHDPELRLRDIASTLGITERSASTIVADLTESGHVTKTKDGRRNRYEIDGRKTMRDPIGREHPIGELLDLLTKPTSKSRSSPKRD
jgi:Mn-dependent DtxR family transcriptional regulator